MYDPLYEWVCVVVGADAFCRSILLLLARTRAARSIEGEKDLSNTTCTRQNMNAPRDFFLNLGLRSATTALILIWTYDFVRCVWTVEVSVAAPSLGDTIAVSTGKVSLAITVVLRTFGLVTPVAAVVLEVTQPPLLNALAIVTGELVRGACLLWKLKDRCYYWLSQDVMM